MLKPSTQPDLARFFDRKSEHTLELFNHFVQEYQKLAAITLEPTKTMIAVDNGRGRIAWVTQLGKNFIHVVFPFKEPYEDNLCFQKVVQVPGSQQFNHHLRVLNKADINAEVKKFMKLALKEK
jgi:hypothetical protein